MRRTSQLPTSDLSDATPCPLNEAAAGAERARSLHEDAKALVLIAEDNLSTVLHRFDGLAAGIPQPVDVDPNAPHAPDAIGGVVPPARPRRPRIAVLAGLFVAISATAGALVSMGGATPASGTAEGVEPAASIVYAAEAAAGPAAADPNPVLAIDPGKLYSSRFAKVPPGERLCLARAIYYEARGEAIDGQIAVAQVILNRARSAKWPSTICGVVNQGIERGEKCQFSFACSLHASELDAELWDQAQTLAEQAVAGQAWLRETLEATHYHTTSVAPVWRLGLAEIGTIGSHVFYRETNGLREAAGSKAARALATASGLVGPAMPGQGALKVARSKAVATSPSPRKGADDNWAARMFQP